MRNFAVLSDFEFEALIADLLSADLGTAVERFARGQDGGVDLRWAQGVGVAQCKHYTRSTFAQLMSAARQECSNLEVLSPKDYRFITSFDLSFTQKAQLYSQFGKWMRSAESVLGGSDVDALLTRYQHVERRHTKLWLSTGTQLFWSQHSNLVNRATALQSRIDKSLKLYVMNRGYDRALSMLEEHGVCIIAGAPGIGKSSLAHALVAESIRGDYEPFEVSGDIEEGWTALASGKLQVFLYDDFLGELSFKERLGKNEDRRLSDFIDKIRTTRTKRLILTTREYVLKAAQQEYDRLRDIDPRLHFALELSSYTRVERAQILYNHLWHADLPKAALMEVALGGYKKIIDHPGYNPRLIEYCTGEAFDTHGKEYPARFADMLSHPDRLWRTAFEKHLTKRQQWLVFTTGTLPAGVPIEDLQKAYLALCRALQDQSTLSDVRSDLAAMEGAFLTLEQSAIGPVATLANPSVRSFIVDCLARDEVLLVEILRCAVFFEQIQKLYSFASGSFEGDETSQRFHEALGRHGDDFVAAVMRTLRSPSLRRGFYSGRGLCEERMLFCLALPQSLRPNDDWILDQLGSLTRRWERREGEKARAVELMRAIAWYSPDDKRDFAEVKYEASSALRSWLEHSLEDAEDDWAPYLEWLEMDQCVDISSDNALVSKFETFVNCEFDRWEPSPPNLHLLRAHANKLNVSRKVQKKIREAIEREEEEDQLAAEQLKPNPKPARTKFLDQSSDEEVSQMFLRLLGP